ncbi:ornithine carbamoyltransferase [Thermoactinomyces mirandus]|uniref:Ornithine carbamoyltransferase n=1 Tax=Thermoactinomyces mirandus TaxID=2756294 RepID=A0A7W2ATG8_9BACL|nr:ornithine carbamoyltransferase [Thermoactinomyces mirandus]MBA4603501.1 ornithine carbamoyltransferase [Thermoactinomyces mirandus]
MKDFNQLFKEKKGKSFLTLDGWQPDELEALLLLAKQLKSERQQGMMGQPLKGKSLAMIFEKPSTRTRISFEVGMKELGGYTLHLGTNELQLGRGETLEDTARILSRYVDAILIRTCEHARIQRLADAATIPVINGLSDLAHPCQAVADLLTILETKGKLKGVKLSFIGDGNNVLHSLMHASALAGIHLSIATPAGYEPDADIWKKAEQIMGQTGGTLTFSHDPHVAAEGADVVYTDVWASMGQEQEKEKRQQSFLSYQVNARLMAHAAPDAVFMHCLPAYRGLEVTGEVLEGAQSVVFDQAENRLHAQKALLMALLG